MFATFLQAVAVVLCSASLLLSGRALAQAQVPQEIVMKLDEVTVRLTDFEVVVGGGNPQGGAPVDPKPLDSSKLLQPGQVPGITFAYERDGELRGGAFPNLGLKIPPFKTWGYQGASLPEKKGRAGISLFVHPSNQPTELNEEIKLVLFEGQKEVESEQAIPVRCRVDGIVQLSTTQFEAIRALGRRLVELEKKVQELEAAVARK